MKKNVLITLILLVSCIYLTAQAKPLTATGTINIHLPRGKGIFPCVILCPGRGYHKNRPLLKDFAKQAVDEGFAAIRFDWDFFTAGTDVSDELETEIQQLEKVVEQIKAIPQIDTTRIYLAGKSLGSLIAYRVFLSDKSLRGIILLTPVIPAIETAEEMYPGLKTEERKVVFILGNEDFNSCRLQTLYRYLAECKAAVPVISLAGGHGFEQYYTTKDPYLQKLDKSNVNTAVECAVYWLKTFENPVLQPRK